MDGWCTKCRVKREMKNPTPTTTKNGRHMMKGVCGTCVTKMCKFVKKNSD